MILGLYLRLISVSSAVWNHRDGVRLSGDENEIARPVGKGGGGEACEKDCERFDHAFEWAHVFLIQAGSGMRGKD